MVACFTGSFRFWISEPSGRKCGHDHNSNSLHVQHVPYLVFRRSESASNKPPKRPQRPKCASSWNVGSPKKFLRRTPEQLPTVGLRRLGQFGMRAQPRGFSMKQKSGFAAWPGRGRARPDSAAAAIIRLFPRAADLVSPALRRELQVNTVLESEPCSRQHACQRGQVAQLVERSPEKAGVGGSIPSLATTSYGRLFQGWAQMTPGAWPLARPLRHRHNARVAPTSTVEAGGVRKNERRPVTAAFSKSDGVGQITGPERSPPASPWVPSRR